MAETVAVHHPAHPGSDMVVSRKVFDIDLSREGYVEGRSDGSRPVTAPTPAAHDGGTRESVSAVELEELRGAVVELQAAQARIEERETAVALREVELDERERELEAREEELAASYADKAEDTGAGDLTPEQQAEAAATPSLAEEQAGAADALDAEAQRKARKAAAERERRARKAAEAASTDAGQTAGQTPPEDA